MFLRRTGGTHRSLCRASHRLRHFATSLPVGSSSGSVLRLDEMTGTWVVFASGRKDRPQQTTTSSAAAATLRNQKLEDIPSHLDTCPFCQGNEDMTPETLLTVGTARVIPNKFPAVGPLPRRGDKDDDFSSGGGSGGNAWSSSSSPHHHHHEPFADRFLLNNEVDAVGFHEVVVESPIHNAHLATSSDHGHARNLLLAFRDRGRAHRETAPPMDGDGGEVDAMIEHTCYFKNHGGTAGASLVHPHSQIVSTPVVPVEAQRLQSIAADFFRKNRRSLYERICEEELSTLASSSLSAGERQSRVVDTTENFLAVVPYASPGPYVITIIPRIDGSGREEDGVVDCSDFTTTSDDLIDECAHLLRSCMVRLHTLLNEPCFNLVVQTAPVPNRGVQAAVQASTFFRWHIRITPRLGAGAMAGFELGSGFFSNSHMPEDDAAELRAVLPSTNVLIR